MPIEFEEEKRSTPIPRFSPTGRRLENIKPAAAKKSISILAFLVKHRLAKNEDYAKLYLLIVIIIIFSLTVFYGLQTYQNFNPQDVNTAPIDLNQIEVQR